MITTRHPRGRGQVMDFADVSRHSFISRDSVVQGTARVRGARLINESCADEECQLYGGTIDRSYVGGKTVVAGNPTIMWESWVACRAISGNARVGRSWLEGIVEVFDDAVVDQVHLWDAVMVYGTAKLWGPWELGGFARIHEGNWMRAPRVVELEHTCITECIEGRILIECRCRSKEWWLRFGPAFGRRAGWTEAQVEETVKVIADFKN